MIDPYPHYPWFLIPTAGEGLNSMYWLTLGLLWIAAFCSLLVSATGLYLNACAFLWLLLLAWWLRRLEGGLLRRVSAATELEEALGQLHRLAKAGVATAWILLLGEAGWFFCA